MRLSQAIPNGYKYTAQRQQPRPKCSLSSQTQIYCHDSRLFRSWWHLTICGTSFNLTITLDGPLAWSYHGSPWQGDTDAWRCVVGLQRLRMCIGTGISIRKSLEVLRAPHVEWNVLGVPQNLCFAIRWMWHARRWDTAGGAHRELYPGRVCVRVTRPVTRTQAPTLVWCYGQSLLLFFPSLNSATEP